MKNFLELDFNGRAKMQIINDLGVMLMFWEHLSELCKTGGVL